VRNLYVWRIAIAATCRRKERMTARQTVPG